MNNTIKNIAFDLHGVVFHVNFKQVCSILWHYKPKWRAIPCVFKFRLIYKSIWLLFNDPTDEEYFALFNRWCSHLVPLVTDLMNAYTPVPSTIELIKKLKAKGYTIDIISNIGPSRFAALQKKYPEIMNLFSYAQINNGNAQNILKKPNPVFFEQYLKIKHVRAQQVIFIDDNKKNCAQAHKQGFNEILFKDPCQLATRLAWQQVL